ncbi:MAG: Na+/galactose cotransporter, partial [Gemmatimonadota bacterium]
MTASRFSLIDYVVLLVSLAAVLGIGWRLRGGVRGVADFLFGDRLLPSWVAGLGLLAANVGVQEVIGMGAAGAKYGFAAAHVFWLGAIPAMVFLGLFMMPVYRSAGARSVPEYLGLRFDAKSRTLSAVAFATMMVLASGVVLYVLGSAAHVLLGWNFGAVVTLAAGISLTYVLWGGLTGTIYAGVLQFVLLVFGLAPLLLIGFAATDGWPMLQHRLTQAAINSQLPQGFYTHLWTGMGHPLTNAFGVSRAALLMGLGGALAFGYWCTDVRVVQRAMTARSTMAARRAPLIAAVPMLLLPALLAIPGMLALMLGGGEAGRPYGGMAQGLIPATRAADGTALLDAAGRTLLDFDIATPKLLATLYPSGMLGLGVAALLAACLAAMAANLTAFNTVITWDLYRARVRFDASDASDLRVARVATLVGALLAIAAAYGVQAFGNLLNFLQLMVAFVNEVVT